MLSERADHWNAPTPARSPIPATSAVSWSSPGGPARARGNPVWRGRLQGRCQRAEHAGCPGKTVARRALPHRLARGWPRRRRRPAQVLPTLLAVSSSCAMGAIKRPFRPAGDGAPHEGLPGSSFGSSSPPAELRCRQEKPRPAGRGRYRRTSADAVRTACKRQVVGRPERRRLPPPATPTAITTAINSDSLEPTGAEQGHWPSQKVQVRPL